MMGLGGSREHARDGQMPNANGTMTQDERAELERRYPGWHAWVSDSGTKYATRARGFGGLTLDAGSWDDLDAKLADSTTPEGPSGEV